jgi:hypothetical protein
MEKTLKADCKSFDVTEGITIDEFNDKYNQIISQLKDKYGYISNIKIHAESGTYNDDEDYYEEINIRYSRYETDEEFEKRVNWIEYRKSEQEKIEIEKMKEYISSHTDEAIKYINSLTKK